MYHAVCVCGASVVQWNSVSEVITWMHLRNLHSVTSEKQFHCTRLCVYVQPGAVNLVLWLWHHWMHDIQVYPVTPENRANFTAPNCICMCAGVCLLDQKKKKKKKKKKKRKPVYLPTWHMCNIHEQACIRDPCMVPWCTTAEVQDVPAGWARVMIEIWFNLDTNHDGPSALPIFQFYSLKSLSLPKKVHTKVTALAGQGVIIVKVEGLAWVRQSSTWEDIFYTVDNWLEVKCWEKKNPWKVQAHTIRHRFI